MLHTWITFPFFESSISTYGTSFYDLFKIRTKVYQKGRYNGYKKNIATEVCRLFVIQIAEAYINQAKGKKTNGYVL